MSIEIKSALYERYIVREQSEDRYSDYGWELYDKEEDRVIGTDGGEPEDQLLVRDWAWVCVEFNRLAAQIRDRDKLLKNENELYRQATERVDVLQTHNTDLYREMESDKREIARLNAAIVSLTEDYETLMHDYQDHRFV